MVIRSSVCRCAEAKKIHVRCGYMNERMRLRDSQADFAMESLPFVATRDHFVAKAQGYDKVLASDGGDPTSSVIGMTVQSMTLRLCADIARKGSGRTYFVPTPMALMGDSLQNMAVFYRALQRKGWEVRVVQQPDANADDIPIGHNVAQYPSAGLLVVAGEGEIPSTAYPLNDGGLAVEEGRSGRNAEIDAAMHQLGIAVDVPSIADATTIGAAENSEIVETVYFMLSQLFWSMAIAPTQCMCGPPGIVDADTIGGAVSVLRQRGWAVGDPVVDEFFEFGEVLIATGTDGKLPASDLVGDLIIGIVIIQGIPFLFRLMYFPLWLLGKGIVMAGEAAIAATKLGFSKLFQSKETYAVTKATIYREMGWTLTRRMKSGRTLRTTMRNYIPPNYWSIMAECNGDTIQHVVLRATDAPRFGLWDDRRNKLFDKLTFDGKRLPDDPEKINTSSLFEGHRNILANIDASALLLDLAAFAVASHASAMGAINYHLWKLINRFMIEAYGALPYGKGEDSFLKKSEPICIGLMNDVERMKVIGVDGTINTLELVCVMEACYIFHSLATKLGWTVRYGALADVQAEIPRSVIDRYSPRPIIDVLQPRYHNDDLLPSMTYVTTDRKGKLREYSGKEFQAFLPHVGFAIYPKRATGADLFFPFDVEGRNAAAGKPFLPRHALEGDALEQLLAGLPAAAAMRSPTYFNELNAWLQPRELGKVQFEVQLVRFAHCIWERYALLIDEADAVINEEPDPSLKRQFKMAVAIDPALYSAPEFTGAQVHVAVRFFADDLGWPVDRRVGIDVKTGYTGVLFVVPTVRDSETLTDIFYHQRAMHQWALRGQLKGRLGDQPLSAIVASDWAASKALETPFTITNKNSHVHYTLVYPQIYGHIGIVHNRDMVRDDRFADGRGNVMRPSMGKKTHTRMGGIWVVPKVTGTSTTDYVLDGFVHDMTSDYVATSHDNPGIVRFVEELDVEFEEHHDEALETILPLYCLNAEEFVLDVKHEIPKTYSIVKAYSMKITGEEHDKDRLKLVSQKDTDAWVQIAPYRFKRMTLRLESVGTIVLTGVDRIDHLRIEVARGGTCKLSRVTCGTLSIVAGRTAVVTADADCKVTDKFEISAKASAAISGFELAAGCATAISIEDEATVAISAYRGTKVTANTRPSALTITPLEPIIEAPIVVPKPEVREAREILI